MRSKEQVIDDLYTIFFNNKSKQASDEKIEYDIKAYFTELSKFEISCLNEYCGLDNINTNVERLTLKLMSRFYDRFDNEKKGDIANAKIVKEQVSFIKKTTGKMLIFSYLAFVVGIMITIFLSRNGDMTGYSPLVIFIVYFGYSAFFYLIIMIFLKTKKFLYPIIAFAVIVYLYRKFGNTEENEIKFLFVLSIIAIITLVITTITFILNNKKADEFDKEANEVIEKANNNY